MGTGLLTKDSTDSFGESATGPVPSDTPSASCSCRFCHVFTMTRDSNVLCAVDEPSDSWRRSVAQPSFLGSGGGAPALAFADTARSILGGAGAAGSAPSLLAGVGGSVPAAEPSTRTGDSENGRSVHRNRHLSYTSVASSLYGARVSWCSCTK